MKRFLYLGISSGILLRWTPQGHIVDKSAWRHQAIILTYVDSDLCCHMASLGHIDLINSLRPSDAYASFNLAIIESNNGLLPDPCQAIIWTNARILLFGP